MTLSGLAGGTTYYFAVSAIDTYGVEPVFSNEASVAVPVPTPLVLQAYGTSPTSRDVELSWNPSPNSDVYGYMVQYGTQSGVYTNFATFYYTTDGIISDLAGGTTYYFAVSAMDVNGVENILSNEASVAVPVPPPIVLQTQTFTDGSGQLHLQINTYSVVSGSWEMDYSTDLQNWFYYTSGYGYGNGDGYDVYVDAPVDPNEPHMFFCLRTANAVSVPPPIVLQTQTITAGSGQPAFMQINTRSVVNGSWEMDYSTDLQNWYYYTSGYGNGNGDGYDVNVEVPIDPTEPQMFFRLINY
jgi:hypothetical protein